MGWDFGHYDTNMSIHDCIVNRYKDADWSIIDHSLHGNEYYAAAEFHTGPNAGKVTALVILFSRRKDYYNFGCKFMDESALPYYFHCPIRILKKLSPLDVLFNIDSISFQNAKEWRNFCFNRKRRIDIYGRAKPC
jgi:hypothetical protein